MELWKWAISCAVKVILEKQSVRLIQRKKSMAGLIESLTLG